MPTTHDAFLSYSHRADGELAASIETGLERLAKPLLRLRAMDVFRDQTSLTASPTLWNSILEHLSGSRWFILLACPASAQSPWCVKEVSWWLENRSLQTVLIVLTDGELRWDPAASDFDWATTTALSNKLAGKLADEPLHVDLRWALGNSRAASQDSRFHEEIVSLAAPIRGMGRDELDSADKRQLLRNRALVRGLQGGLGVVAVMALGAAAYATVQKRQAISEAALAKAQAHASQALLNVRTTPLVALGSAIAANDLAAAYPSPNALESAVLWAMRAEAPALDPPSEADVALRQSLVFARLRAVFEAPKGTGVEQIDGAPARSMLVARMSDHSVIVLDAEREEVIARREPDKDVAAAFLMASGRDAMIVGKGGAIVVWEFGSGNESVAGSLPPDKSPAFAVTPQRDRVMRHGAAGTWLIDASDGTVSRAKTCPQMSSLRGAMSAAGSVLSVQVQSNRLEICDVLSGRARKTIRTPSDTLDVQFSPDGRYVGTTSMTDETVRVWDITTGSEQQVFRGHTAVPMKLAFSADSQRLAVGIADGNLYSWRLRKDASKAEQQDQIFMATGADGSIHHVQELMDGKRIVTAHSALGGQQYLRLWSGPTDVDVTFMREQSKVHSAMIDSKARRIWRVTADGLTSTRFDGADEVASGRASTLPIRKGGFTRDRSYAFAVDDDGKVEAWSIASASQSHSLPTGTPVIDAQPIGQCCLLALLHERGQSTVYDLAHPDRAAETLQLGEDVKLVRFGGRVDRIFVETSTTAEIRVSGQRNRLIKGNIGRPPRGSAFAAEDQSVFLLSDYDTRLLDSTEMRNDHVLSGHAAGISDGQVSPDGSRVATASVDWTARIWDAASGAQTGVLRGHSNEVTQVEFRSDGQFIASASRDGTIRVWNTIGGEELLRIEVGTNAKARILSFENEYLLVGTGNKLGLYRCVACRPSVELLREARERIRAGIPKELALGRAGDTSKVPALPETNESGSPGGKPLI